jgi:hypothetical protein
MFKLYMFKLQRRHYWLREADESKRLKCVKLTLVLIILYEKYETLCFDEFKFHRYDLR